MKIRRDDMVVVIAGKDRGKKGKVLRVSPTRKRLIVEGVNIVKRAIRPTQRDPQGGFSEKPAFIAVSNVMIVCPSCGAATRIGYKTEGDGTKDRICKQCNAVVDKG